MSYFSKSKVAVIFNQKQLGLLLKKYPPKAKNNNLFIDFSMGSFDKKTLLEQAGFEKISKTKANLDNQKAFIQEYITLIGKIGRKNS